MKQLALFFMVLLSSQLSAVECDSNENLKKNGFIVTTRNFNSQFEKAKTWLDIEQDNFVEDLSGIIRSTSANTHVYVTSFDHLSTPQTHMYGDVVFIVNHWDDTPLEVRWFSKGKKYVAYNKNYQSCATNVIPVAVNTLF